MRITLTSVFFGTLILGWVFFAWFGDYNLYVVRQDGSKWVKEYAMLSDKLIFGFIVGVIFAAFDTAALWAWDRMHQTFRTGVPENRVYSLICDANPSS